MDVTLKAILAGIEIEGDKTDTVCATVCDTDDGVVYLALVNTEIMLDPEILIDEPQCDFLAGRYYYLILIKHDGRDRLQLRVEFRLIRRRRGSRRGVCHACFVRR